MTNKKEEEERICIITIRYRIVRFIVEIHLIVEIDL